MYYIVYGALYLFSLLPLWVLYLFADLVYLIIYYITGYRKKIVFDNLRRAFPEKTEKELTIIAKKFYHNLIDTFIETIKMVSCSNRFLDKRVKGNWELVNTFKESGRNIQLHLGHNFNWEWANGAGAQHFTMTFVGVYMPITNKIFDRLFIKLRSRTGTKLVRATHMREDFLQYRNEQYVLGLAADQSPGAPGSAWWFNFLGRPTPFVKGPAKNAVLQDTVVLFANIHKPGRGHYVTELSLAVENAGSMTEQQLTGMFVTYLEGVVRKYPEMWLWSHRRWKWEWKPEFGEINK